MTEIPNYPPAPTPKPTPLTTVERSVSRDGAFSKPGSFGKSTAGKWSPAKGVRFRPTNEKAPGRRPGRKRRLDPRKVKFY